MPDAPTLPEHWIYWLALNMMRGNDDESLLRAGVPDGLEAGLARAKIAELRRDPAIEAGRSLYRELQKRDWLLGSYHKLERLVPGAQHVERVAEPSRDEFLRNYYTAHRPVIITGAMKHWPALRRWTAEYFKARCGDVMVEILGERGADPHYEQNKDEHKRRLRFSEYVDAVEGATSTNDFYLHGYNNNPELQERLFADADHLPRYLNPERVAGCAFLWYGPRGAVTTLHHDLTNNFMAQVRGRKLVKLISSCQTPNIYNYRHCWSQVDLNNIDYQRFPLFRNVDIVTCVLEPGEVLFLPVGCWHQVTSLDVTVTVSYTNFWYDNDFWSSYQSNGPIYSFV